MDSSDKQSQQVSPKTEKIPSQEFKTAMDDDNLAQNTIIPNETISGKKLYENVAEIITLMKPETITEEKKTDDESHLENIPKPETSSPKEKCQKSAENALEPEVLSGVSEKTEHKSTVNNSANLETAEKKTEEDQPSEEPTSDHNKTTMEKEIEEKQVEHPLMSEVVPSDEKTEQISKEENTLNPYFPQNDKTEPKPEEENNSDKPEKGIEENVLEGYTEKVRNDTEEENTQITGSLNVNKANGEEKEEEEPTKPLEKREAAQGKPNAQQQQPETITGEKENTAMLLDQLLMKEMEEKWIGG
ncbi:unnamed protein product [Cuscuta europaea]|uniref:Uncharacterized protein n=1 Tax=Cuscuta europaea TaxID=41803 RepID=A0A9P1EJ46_CUSEU|nr:unnamed protein product [Cuscuta europaea]